MARKKLSRDEQRRLLLQSALQNANEDPEVLRIRQQLEARARGEEEEDWSDIQSSADHVDTPEPGFLEGLLDSASASVSRMEAGSNLAKAERQITPLTLMEGLSRVDVQSGADQPTGTTALRNLPGVGFVAGLLDSLYDTATLTPEQRNALRAQGLSQLTEAEQSQQRADEAQRSVRASIAANPIANATRVAGPLSLDQLTETAFDLSQSPLSYVSAVPGLGAVVAPLQGQQAFAQAYLEGIKGGLTPEKAAARANSVAGIEMGFSALPFGRALKIGGGTIRSSAGDILGRTLRDATGEALNEAATEAATMGLDKTLSGLDDKQLADFAKSQLPANITEFFQREYRAARAGFFGGGTMAAGANTIEVMADRGRLASKALEENTRTLNELRRRADAKQEFVLRRPEEEQKIGRGEVVQAELFPNDPFRGTVTESAPQPVSSDQQPSDVEANFRTRVRSLDSAIEQDRNRLAELELQRAYEQQFTEAGATPDPWTDNQINRILQRLPEIQAARDALARRVSPQQPELFGQMPEQPASPIFTGQEEGGGRLGGPIRTRDPDKYYAPQGNLRSRTQDRASKEAVDLVEKDTNKLEDARKKAYDSLRKRARQQIVESTRDITDPAARVEEVAKRLADWDKANPIESFKYNPRSRRGKSVSQPALKDDIVSPIAQQPAIEPELAPEAADTLEKLKNKYNNAPLASVSQEPRSNLKAEDVLKHITKKIHKKDPATVAKLIADGNMVIVDDPSQVPNNAEERGAGFYDGERTYIVANQLNENNVMGAVLSTSVHEVKHAGDIGGTDNLRKKYGLYIGEEANNNIISKVERLADEGNVLAKRVIELARSEYSPEDYKLELPAIAAQLAYSARANRQGLGKFGGVVKDILSATKTAFAKTTGVDVDLDMNDLGYLAEQFVRDVAKSGNRLTGDLDKTLPMILGEEATSFKLADAKGLTYLSKDGRKKFLISDKDSELTLDEDTVDKLLAGNRVRLGKILKHDKLAAEYPMLKEAVDVAVDPSLPTGNARFQQGTIYLSSEDVRYAGFHKPTADTLRRTVLHETQHAVQDIEDHARGGSPSEFLTDKDKLFIKKAATAKETIEKLTASSKIEGIRSLLDDRYKAEIDQAVAAYQAGEISRLELADTVVSATSNAKTNKTAMAYGRNLDYAIKEFRELAPVANQLSATAHANYRNMLGELEAWFTADNADLDIDELPVNPENPNDPKGFRRKPEEVIIAKRDKRIALASRSEILDAALEAYKKPDNRVIRRVKQLIDSKGGIDSALNEKIEDSFGQAALYAHKAMSHMNRLNAGIERMAKRTGKTEAQIKEFIQQSLDEASKIEDQSRREAYLGRLAQNNPELRPLVEGIQDINQMTAMIIAQYIKSHPKLTAKDVALLKTLDDNMWRYSHRMFAAFQGDVGKQWAQALVDSAKAAEKALKKGRDIPDKHKESLRIWRNAVDYLAKHDLSIPETHEGFARLDNRSLKMLHSNWVPGDVDRAVQVAVERAKAEGMTDHEARAYAREVLIQELLAVRQVPGFEQRAIRKAEDIALSILDLKEGDNPLIKYYRGLKEDRTILERRTQIPKELRELMGEITDPATRLGVTLAKQAELAARTRLMLEIIRDGYGKWVVPEAEADLPGNERFTYSLSGENWGVLNGWRATPEVGERLADSLEMVQTVDDAITHAYQNTEALWKKAVYSGAKGLVKAASLTKLATVVLEPFGIYMNALGSPAMLMMQGINPAGKYGRAGQRVAMEVVIDTLYDGKGNPSKELQDAIRYGILDSARVQEIRRTPQQHVKEIIRSGKVGQTSKARLAGRATVETYAMVDAWVKISAFMERVDLLKSVYKAEGVEKTETEIKREAADFIKDTNITYSRTPALVRGVESLGITTFLPYFYSVPRSIFYSYVNGYKDLVRSSTFSSREAQRAMRKAGLLRIGGATAALTLMTSGLKALAAAMSDDPERDEELAKLMPNDVRFADLVYLGKDDKGTPLFFSLSRADPYGPLTDAIRVYSNSELSLEEKNRHAMNSLVDLVFANRMTLAATKLLAGSLPEAKPEGRPSENRLERIAPGLTTDAKAWMVQYLNMDMTNAETVIDMINSISPGWMDALDPKNKAPESALPFPEAGIVGQVVVASGGRLYRADPALASKAAGAGVNAVRKEGRKLLADYIKAGREPPDLVEDIMYYQLQEYEAVQEANRVYEGMTKGLGLSAYKAAELLREEGGLTQTDVAGIRQGRVLGESTSWIKQYSRMAVESSLREQTIQENRMSKEEKAEAQKRINDLLNYARVKGVRITEN